MPWNIVTCMSQKEEFIKLSESGYNISELCRRYGISRKTGYKWLRRFSEDGILGLEERSRKPLSSPSKTNPLMEEAILSLRLQQPFWGGRKLKAYLERNGHTEVPSPSTISNILKRHALINEYPSSRTAHYRRFEHEAPNRLWQMDFKGYFYMENRKQCHPLDILDDHSRYLLSLTACANQQKDTVKAILEDVFRRYGIPDRINIDNGSPWGNTNVGVKFTKMALWLIKHGVKVSYSRFYHPQTNGKIERMHRTLKQEVINNHYYKNLADVQKSFDNWKYIYNHKRPHEALDMEVPIDRYKPSYRSYKDKVDEYEYSDEFKLFRVDNRGRIRFCKKEIFTSTALAGEIVGVIPTEKEGKLKLFFRNQFIMNLDLS